ncbi:YoaK family protein [Terrihabitans rhizophilus]|uniref:YoaK family protein n=1 Tax=Terrihabitans rhizophilus TaxID=3092662 RepID=A0ABU4RU84_9HYPH|nr:YoaK family protein [Terrihabitans sp. PJ23]MDX6807205.1 YoaK family protein [Terrihabitans sp. PJ23]
MIGYRKRLQVLAIALSALAGYVDAIGFLELGGFFVSFMSGNSTRMAVGLADHAADAWLAAALIATFVTGVVLGSVVSHTSGRYRRAAVLLVVALLLSCGVMLDEIAPAPWAMGAVVLAMGAENAVFQRDGEVSIGVTYMTGTLVKFGQRLAGSFFGGAPFAWLPYLLLWAGLSAGAAAGALIYPHFGLQALWAAAAAAALMAGLTLLLKLEE